jgi:hypothetical protein
MRSVVYAFLSTVGMLFRSRFSLQAEVIALRHQLTVYHRSVRRLQIRPADWPRPTGANLAPPQTGRGAGPGFADVT